MQVFNRHVSARGLTVFGFETILISGSILVAATMHGSLDDAAGSVWKVVLITALCELCFYYNDLYDLTCVHAKGELLVRVLQGLGAAAIALAAVSMLLPSLRLGSGTFLTTLGVLVVAMPLWRFAFDGLTNDPRLEEHVLIVGTGALARSVARQILEQHDFAYRVVGFIDDRRTHARARRDGFRARHAGRPARIVAAPRRQPHRRRTLRSARPAADYGAAGG